MQLSIFLCRTAWRSLAQHKGRSLLTIISIIVGIAAVIATLAIGRGAQEKIRERISSMGSNVLVIHSFAMPSSGSTTVKQHKRSRILQEDDISYLRSLCPEIKDISGVCNTNDRICTYRNRRILAPFTICQSSFLTMTKREISYGRNFSAYEDRLGGRVCILGAHAARDLFKSTPPLGKTILVDGAVLTVIGVLESVDNFQMFGDRNMGIFIPLATGRRIFTSLTPTEVRTLYISGHEGSDLSQLERTIRRVMRARHQLRGSEPDDFTIVNQAGMMAAAEQSGQVFNLFLLIVASLSLLVGGIGVSNIMLVSVTERTKEIGIRLALGASPASVLFQFLVESVMLCSAGGLLGVFFGISVPYLVSFATGWTVIVTLSSVVYSVLITMLIGVVFGFWPAKRAARMNVVEALHDR